MGKPKFFFLPYISPIWNKVSPRHRMFAIYLPLHIDLLLLINGWNSLYVEGVLSNKTIFLHVYFSYIGARNLHYIYKRTQEVLNTVSWGMTRSDFVNFWATKVECDVSNSMYFVMQLYWLGANHSKCHPWSHECPSLIRKIHEGWPFLGQNYECHEGNCMSFCR